MLPLKHIPQGLQRDNELKSPPGGEAQWRTSLFSSSSLRLAFLAQILQMLEQGTGEKAGFHTELAKWDFQVSGHQPKPQRTVFVKARSEISR